MHIKQYCVQYAIKQMFDSKAPLHTTKQIWNVIGETETNALPAAEKDRSPGSNDITFISCKVSYIYIEIQSVYV